MKLFIIRHGDPDYEHDSLTPTGRMEAEALSEGMETETQHQSKDGNTVFVALHMAMLGMGRQSFEELLNEESRKDAKQG